MRKILLIRTSSMGDLIHTWPAISDLSRQKMDLKLSWLVEENFVDIAKLHPFVSDVIPIAWRRCFKQITSIALWRNLLILRNKLKEKNFDLVIDSQGLLKSAIPSRWAGAPVAGYDKHSIKERAASYFYQNTYQVSRDLSAIERNRRLFALVFGYKLEGAACFGVSSPPKPACSPRQQYVVLLHNASRNSKLWSNEKWIDLAKLLLNDYGLVSLLLWGNVAERERAKILACKMPQSLVMPKLSLYEAAGLLGNAKLVVGVDTGLLHLANALDVTLIGLYTDTDPKLTGVVERLNSFNLGGIGQSPKVEDVKKIIRHVFK